MVTAVSECGMCTTVRLQWLKNGTTVGLITLFTIKKEKM